MVTYIERYTCHLVQCIYLITTHSGMSKLKKSVHLNIANDLIDLQCKVVVFIYLYIHTVTKHKNYIYLIAIYNMKIHVSDLYVGHHVVRRDRVPPPKKYHTHCIVT